MCLALNWIPKIMVYWVCYLRVYYDVQSVSWRFLLRMARMEMDWNLKVGPTFSSFDAISTKNNKNVIMGCSFWYNSLDIHLIKPLSNDFSEELIQNNKIFITWPFKLHLPLCWSYLHLHSNIVQPTTVVVVPFVLSISFIKSERLFNSRAFHKAPKRRQEKDNLDIPVDM